MIKQLQSKIIWIDIINPTQSDIDYLGANFKFHPLILAELLKPTTRTRVEIYDHYLFSTYHLPVYSQDCRTSIANEIDFLITKNALITVRYKNVEPIDELFRKLENNPSLRERILDKNSGFLLYEILQNSLSFSLRQLNHINEKIENVEERIFKGEEKNMIKEISIIKRDVLDQRQISRPQKLVLESLLMKGIKFFGKDMEVYLNDLLGDYGKIWDTLDNLKETIEALESTNNTLFESKTNEVMKLLTIMAFVTFPLSLFSGIFSMNTQYTPIVHHQFGFWIIVVIMLIISLGFIIFFKIKKWL